MKQIGEKMNCTPNAVGKLVAQAREKLGIGLK
jgi:DNA-binding CsgD family transcriptional regulator